MTWHSIYTVATAAGIDVIIPCPAYLVALFDNDKVPTTTTLDHIDSCAHPYLVPITALEFVSTLNHGSVLQEHIPEIPAPMIRTSGELMLRP